MVRQVIPLVVVLAIGTTLVGLFQSQRSAAATASSGLDASHQNLRRLLADAEARAQKAEAELSQARHAAATMSAERDSTDASARQQMQQQQPSSLAQPISASGARDDSFVHSIDNLHAAGIKPGDLMMTTYATGGVREMLYNWVLHVQRLGLPILVSAMDKQVVEQCTAQRFHCLDWSHTASAE